MRLPLAADLISRDGTTGKDSRIRNGFAESGNVIRKRPGMFDLGSIGAGAAQLLADWQGKLLGVTDDLITYSDIVSGSAAEGELLSYAGQGSTQRIAANGNYGVAVFTGAGLYTTSDGGDSWEPTFSITGFGSVAFGNGRFVHVKSSIATSDVRYSDDNGATWSDVTSGVSASVGKQIIFAGGYFFLCGINGTLFTSTDGVSWTDRSIATTNDLTGVAYSGTTWAIGTTQGKVYTASSLSSWAENTSGFAPLTVSAYGNGVFVGTDGVSFYTSSDGASWSFAYDTGDSLVSQVAFFNEFFWAKLEYGGDLLVSADGVSWSVSALPTDTTGADWTAISAFGNGLFIGGYTVSGDVAQIYKYQLVSSEQVTVEGSLSLTQIDANAELFYNITGAANSSQFLFLKSAKQGYLLDRNMSLSQITDADYPGWSTHAVTSITRSGTTVTVTTSSSTNIKTGTTVTIAGADQAEYNGAKVVTVTGASTFTYQVTGSPATPATGTITATGGITTVPGCVLLDDTFYVMDEYATIYGSDLTNPSSWDALNFIGAIKEPGKGKAIAKNQNYVVAFKEWSTEFFFDAANPVGSPLSPVDNGFTLVGCASGSSVADIDGTLFWVSQTKQNGRGVYLMSGLESIDISTPNIQRILDADDLSSVSAFGFRLGGSSFYVLTLKSSGITIAYDTKSKMWSEWSSLTLKSSGVSVTSLTLNGSVVTAVCAESHGRSDGDPVLIAGATQTEYNGIQQIRYISPTSFSFEVSGSPATPATGTITATGYTSSYFKLTKQVRSLGRTILLHESSGHVFKAQDTYGQDDAPIDFDIRTGKFDGDTTRRKTNGRIEVIGNKADAKAMLRWSDDDYQTYSAYRPVDLSKDRAQLNRCGSFRRRAFQFRYIGNTPVQISALEIDLGE